MSHGHRPTVGPATVLLILIFILSLLGLLFVFDASVGEAFATFQDQYHFLRQHGMWLAIGWMALIVGYAIPTKWWKTLSLLLYGGALLLLLLVFVPGIGKELNGAHRWIFIGSASLQPVEIMKFAMIVFFASWMSGHQRLMPFLVTSGIPLLLVILQPDLGSLLILSGIAVGLYFTAGGKMINLAGIGGLGLIFLLLAVMTSSYRWQRVKTFFNPEADPLGAGFHVRQITLALGRGGWFGQGIGNSRQKFSYIPEASTDSIFAIIAEEVGIVGSVVLIALFGLLFWTIVRIIASLPPNSFEQLLAWGIFLWIVIQTILNLSAVVALVPLTGIPLPFISYGGSALVMLLFSMGVLLKLGNQYNKKT